MTASTTGTVACTCLFTDFAAVPATITLTHVTAAAAVVNATVVMVTASPLLACADVARVGRLAGVADAVSYTTTTSATAAGDTASIVDVIELVVTCRTVAIVTVHLTVPVFLHTYIGFLCKWITIPCSTIRNFPATRSNPSVELSNSVCETRT